MPTRSITTTPSNAVRPGYQPSGGTQRITGITEWATRSRSVRLCRQRLGATMVRPCRITRWFGILVHLRPNECPTGTSHRDGERDDGTCDAVMVPGPVAFS